MYEAKRSYAGIGTARSLSGGTLKRALLLTSLIVGLAAVSAMFAAVAKADSVGPITFEPSQGYVLGGIAGQQGWMKSGLFDVNVASVALFPAAAGYHFGAQALQLSDAFTSGSFGDQAFSPGLLSPAGESPAKQHFTASFRIGTTQALLQPGAHFSVSPDNGTGGRMSYLRFVDQFDGVHVYFDDVQQSGPCVPAGCANFVETDIATLSRSRAHSIRFSIDFKTGPGNDVVKIYIDKKKKITGTTWEDYFRYDPEAAGSGNQVPTVSRVLFRESGSPTAANLGNGFLVDGLTLASSGRHGDNGDNDNDNDNNGDNNDRDNG